MRLDSLTCDPPQVDDAAWSDVDIRCKTRTRALAGVVFRRCSFENTYFGNAPLDMSGVVFQQCTFREVTFMYGQLQHAIFEGGELRNTYFRSANLRDATFRKVLLRKVSFEKADLHGCRFDDVTFQKMDMWGWHGYDGAILPDEQRFEFYETADPIPRLRAALEAGRITLPRERVLAFIQALEAAGVSEGTTTLRHRDWSAVLSIGDFAALGRALTRDG